MSNYNIVLSTEESTVVTEYTPEKKRSDAYQTEVDLEAAFIEMLAKQGYEYVTIHNADALVANLRKQLERLNNYTFTDREWDSFFQNKIANANEGIAEKTRKIQEDYIQNLTREDGTTMNISLINKKNIHSNHLQVINQYVEGGGKHNSRYDVTILVNGLPLVHIELKRRGVALQEAFQQIERYQRESFWASCGLYEYVHLFVISNGTETKYYSNTTRISYLKEKHTAAAAKGSQQKTSNSFDFTSYWADGNNKIIPDLVDFTKTFFMKHTLLNILTRYCVFTSEKLLLVMRPYQIVATERIINQIAISTNYKKTGSVEAGGYIWHTTGSGKTLTSFKTAQLAAGLPYIDKVLFVVDRKDLDYQTIKEYDRFEKGAANSNKSTAILQQQLEDNAARIIVTTIQKLDMFITKNRTHPIYQQHVVLVFDECHRSQFGQMHTNIIQHFKRYHIFGFTGTPIFAANANSGSNARWKTTEQAFGTKLHTYTILDAINDKNVLPFLVQYIRTIKWKDGRSNQDRKVTAIDTEEVLSSPERIAIVARYILEEFDRKTCRTQQYELHGKSVNGFNSMLAVSSIPACKRYYLELKRQLAEQHRDLTIATIFSFTPNETDTVDGLLADESFDTDGLDQSSRDFLDRAIADYNQTFHTNFDTSSKGFQDYYKDLSDKVKKRQVDLVIVVNMFLTGFDATTLNTLWVDKNLRMHGLIQAFSRTNRILNQVKSFGNIICFRDLEKETNEAIALFGNKDAKSLVLLRSYEDYYNGFTDEQGREQKGYKEQIQELLDRFPLGQPIIGEQNKKDFVVLFGKILRLRNILSAFDRFKDESILAPIDLQDYTGTYHDIYDEVRAKPEDKDSIMDDVVFETELVNQIEVNIDYILTLIAKYHNSHCQDRSKLAEIDKAIRSSSQLRSRRELIEAFLAAINPNADLADWNGGVGIGIDVEANADIENVYEAVDASWKRFVKERRATELRALIREERLKPEEARRFMENAFRDGVLKTTGIDVDRLMPPMSRFGGSRVKKKQMILQKLQTFFDKYFGLISTREALLPNDANASDALAHTANASALNISDR